MITCSIDLIPDGVVIDVQRASCFTGRWADAAGELGEVVGRVQHRRWRSSSPYLANTRSLKSGMMLLTGQPLLQNGVPQSMQRAPCCFACIASDAMTNSFVVLEARLDGLVALFQTLVLHEAGDFSHDGSLLNS